MIGEYDVNLNPVYETVYEVTVVMVVTEPAARGSFVDSGPHHPCRRRHPGRGHPRESGPGGHFGISKEQSGALH
jgi:hypothetical protein